MRLGLGLGIVKSAASIYKGILDKYPNAVAAYSTRKLKTSYPTTLPADYGGGAAAAYSLRKVKSDYEGSAVKVRRSSDGGLQDIGFDSNGNLDTTALTNFVGGQNLLVQSNQFDTTWFNVRSTETGGQTDKDGGSTAWLLESTDASTSYVQQNVSSSGVQTFSVIAKKGTTDYIYLLVFGSNLAGQYFDLNNGTLASSLYTTIDADIEDLGGGWYRCSLVFQSNVTHVTIYPADSGTSSLSAVGSNIYIQDAQLEEGSTATTYNPTTTGIGGDGHVTRWYSQSDPVDTYTADFSGGVDGFSATPNNTATVLSSVTDIHGITVDNVLELKCNDTTRS